MQESKRTHRQAGDPALLRRAATLLLSVLALLWLLIAVRLYFNPPRGLAQLSAALLAVPGAVNALGYVLCAWWVSRGFRWGQVVAVALVGLNLVLGISAGMTWVDWAGLGLNLVALVVLVLLLSGSRRRRSLGKDGRHAA